MQLSGAAFFSPWHDVVAAVQATDLRRLMLTFKP